MQRFTCTEGGAHKFWEGWVEGRTLIVRFGKLGSPGQTRAKDLASPPAAAAALAKVIAEKRAKGYVTDEPSASPGPRAATRAAAPAKGARPTTAQPRAPRVAPRSIAGTPAQAPRVAPPAQAPRVAPRSNAGTPAQAPRAAAPSNAGTPAKAATTPAKAPRVAAPAQAPRVAAPTKAATRSLAAPPAALAHDMAALWARLEAFVAETPMTLDLRPPATAAAIRAAERTIGLPFPADFRASLLVHDGQEPGDGDDEQTFSWLTGHPRLASLDRLVAAWQGDCKSFAKFHADEPATEIEGGRLLHYLWHPRRIPIAGNPWWDQDNTYLDFLPGPRGVAGQLVIFGKGTFGAWCGPSFGATFALYVDAVVSGAWDWQRSCFAREARLHASKRFGSWSRYVAAQLGT
jgi:cell wall assembly regulator SMI1/predicted DNA-binding WGR domain protein